MDLVDLTSLQGRRIQNRTMESAVLDLIADALRQVDTEWSKICQHMEKLLSASEKVFSSTVDDDALFDDDEFSRSRKYSWLVMSLGKFEAAISANIKSWKEYKAECLQPGFNNENDVSLDEQVSTKTTILKIEETVQNLQHTKVQFVRQRGKSRDLRDGVRGCRSRSE